MHGCVLTHNHATSFGVRYVTFFGRFDCRHQLESPNVMTMVHMSQKLKIEERESVAPLSPLSRPIRSQHMVDPSAQFPFDDPHKSHEFLPF